MPTTANNLKITATVREGRLAVSDTQKAFIGSYLRPNEGKLVTVTFARHRKTRSMAQNAYMWGVVLTMIAEHTGNTTEDCHAVLKDLYLPRKLVKMGTREVELRKSTAELTTTQFEIYLESLRAWAANELGLRIPLPNEV